ERVHVDNRPQATANQPLNLVGPAADFALLALPRRAGHGGAGEHGVLGRYPAAAGVAQPSRDTLLDGGIAQHARVAKRDEYGALRSLDEAGSEGERTELGGGASAGAEEHF